MSSQLIHEFERSLSLSQDAKLKAIYYQLRAEKWTSYGQSKTDDDKMSRFFHITSSRLRRCEVDKSQNIPISNECSELIDTYSRSPYYAPIQHNFAFWSRRTGDHI